jgi:hypothetical protein
MSAGLNPADNLNHLNRDSRIPLDSIGPADADREMGLGFDPDIRLQEASRLIFARFRELGSATSSPVPGGGSAPFSSTVRRQANDRLRLDADPLSQRHIGPQEPLLRRRLHLREE